MKGELSTQEARANFLRLLVTNHLDNSIRASKEVASSYRNILGVRSVDEKDANDPNDNASGFLKKSCTFVDLGVYARNLGLTRLVQSPLCYGEAFCQDNFSEALRLADESESVAGIKTSKRILETSDAYLAAILKFFGAKNVTQTELNEHCFTGPNQAISNVNSVIRKVPKVSDFTQPNLAIGSGSTR
jgi:hypothetical protein